MSGVFDKFMGSYVLLERRNLEELLQRLGQVIIVLTFRSVVLSCDVVSVVVLYFLDLLFV